MTRERALILKNLCFEAHQNLSTKQQLDLSLILVSRQNMTIRVMMKEQHCDIKHLLKKTSGLYLKKLNLNCNNFQVLIRSIAEHQIQITFDPVWKNIISFTRLLVLNNQSKFLTQFANLEFWTYNLKKKWLKWLAISIK